MTRVYAKLEAMVEDQEKNCDGTEEAMTDVEDVMGEKKTIQYLIFRSAIHCLTGLSLSLM